MIFCAPYPASAAVPPKAAFAEFSASDRTFRIIQGDTTPSLDTVTADAGDSADLKPAPQPVREQLDWTRKNLVREFIRLEQKVLARKGDSNDTSRYEAMKRDRNSHIFADRAIRDYGEVRRLKKLNQKLAEIQQYLKPVEI